MVASLPLINGLNASLVHKWQRQLSRDMVGVAPVDPASLIPVTLTPPAAADIRIELPRDVLVAVRAALLKANRPALLVRPACLESEKG